MFTPNLTVEVYGKESLGYPVSGPVAVVEIGKPSARYIGISSELKIPVGKGESPADVYKYVVSDVGELCAVAEYRGVVRIKFGETLLYCT